MIIKKWKIINLSSYKRFNIMKICFKKNNIIYLKKWIKKKNDILMKIKFFKNNKIIKIIILNLIKLH